MAKKKSNRGGAREGAGRPEDPNKKIQHSIRIKPVTNSKMEKERGEDSRSTYIEKAIDAYKPPKAEK